MCPLKEQCAPSHGSHGGEDYTTGQGITFFKAKQMGDAEILKVLRLFQKLFRGLYLSEKLNIFINADITGWNFLFYKVVMGNFL